MGRNQKTVTSRRAGEADATARGRAGAAEPVPFRKSTAREYFESIAIAVVLALFVRTWVVQAFKIPTGSMENNLLIGDHLVVNKFVFAPTGGALERAVLPVTSVRRGDIVVFKYPEDPERDFIKRIIGLPGESIEVRQKVVHVDGRPLTEPYVHFLRPVGSGAHEATSFDVRDNYGPVTVPAGHVFVMGDNRDNSQDSRYWGFLPQAYIKGKALMVYWSYDAEPELVAGEGAGATLRRVVSVATNFVTRTRWDRMFHQIR
jgi:signal peptidase I